MDEQLKQPLLGGVVIANFVLIGYQIIFNLNTFSYSKAFFGLFLGLLVGGGVFAAMYFLRRE